MNTIDELKNLIHDKFDIDPATLKVDGPLSEYGLDSLSLAELLFTIEDHFDVSFPDSGSDINTLGALSKMIDELRTTTAA